jgi:hypothetical protein
MDQHNIDDLRSHIREMDEASQRLGGPVNALDIAVTPRDDPRLIKNWVRVTRAQVLALIKETEEDPQRFSREAFFGLAESVGRIIARMEWTVRYASGTARFVTSDRPVVRSFSNGPAAGRGLNDLRAEIRFPLSNTSIIEIKHRQWLLDAVRKKTRRGGPKLKKDTDWTIRTDEADDTFVNSFNQKMAKQAHLLVFSGTSQGWLTEWMKEPLKPEMRAVKILDTVEHLRVIGEKKARLTRKREWVVSHE